MQRQPGLGSRDRENEPTSACTPLRQLRKHCCTQTRTVKLPDHSSCSLASGSGAGASWIAGAGSADAHEQWESIQNAEKPCMQRLEGPSVLWGFPTFHRLSLDERLPITVHLHVHRRAKTNAKVAYLQFQRAGDEFILVGERKLLNPGLPSQHRLRSPHEPSIAAMVSPWSY